MKKFLIVFLALSLIVPAAYAVNVPDNYTLADLEGDLSDVTVGTILVSTAAADAAASVKIIANGIEFEGATADAYETQLKAQDVTADAVVTLSNKTGLVPAMPASFQFNRMWVASDAIASGQTAKTVTVTGITSAAKCVAQGNEVPSNAAYIKSVAPGTDSAVVTVNTDPGASNLDITVICFE
jgi:hypothetical protein